MKSLAKLFGAALLGAFTLLAAPRAQAQVGVNINIGTPSWGPQVPNGTQYYYIPEIDGYYDLYAQQYIVFQDGYWVPLPELYGYDPYQFHPVIVDYRGPQPWSRIGYYHQRYAYQPYRAYPRGGGYYANGYGRSYPSGGYYGGGRNSYGGRGYNDHDDHGRNNRPGSYGGGSYNGPRGGQGQNPGTGSYGGNPRGSQPQPSGPGNNAPGGYGQGGNSQGQGHGQGQGGGRHRD